MEFALDETETHYEAVALDKHQLMQLSLFVRVLCGVKRHERFDPVWFIENFIPQRLDKFFDYEIVDVCDWKYGRNRHSFYNPAYRKIIIRSDVYEGAIAGKGRDIFTLAHEIMHFIIFSIYGIPLFRTVGADGFKGKNKNKLLTIQNPEWQADTAAGFLLCTDEMIKKAVTIKDLMRMSGMSITAARLHIKRRAEKLNKKLYLSVLVDTHDVTARVTSSKYCKRR